MVLCDLCRPAHIFTPLLLLLSLLLLGLFESLFLFVIYSFISSIGLTYPPVQLVVEVGLLGPAALNAAVTTGLLDRLLSEVTTGDGLTQLTALQVLTPLAMSPGGRTLLDEKGVTARLMYLLSLAKSDPIARLLTHGGSRPGKTLAMNYGLLSSSVDRELG